MMVATLVCVAATVALTFVAPGGSNAAFWALAIFVVANVAFEIGMVFYNAFLPALVPPERIGRAIREARLAEAFDGAFND